MPPTPRATLFPYTTLFRSRAGGERARAVRGVAAEEAAEVDRDQRVRADAVVPRMGVRLGAALVRRAEDRKSTRLNSSHPSISYAVFCLKKKKHIHTSTAH